MRMRTRMLTLLLCILLSAATGLADETRLNLLTFNAWGGGLNEGKPIDETLAVLRAAGAQAVGSTWPAILRPTVHSWSRTRAK